MVQVYLLIFVPSLPCLFHVATTNSVIMNDVIDINTSQSQIPNFTELEDTTIDATCDSCDMTIKDSIDSLNIEKTIKILEQIIKTI